MTSAFSTTAVAAPVRAQASNSPRLMLLLLAALFFLPFVVGSGLFWLDWRPTKFANHGDLVQPPRALPESGLHRVDGSPLPTSALPNSAERIWVSGSTPLISPEGVRATSMIAFWPVPASTPMIQAGR